MVAVTAHVLFVNSQYESCQCTYSFFHGSFQVICAKAVHTLVCNQSVVPLSFIRSIVNVWIMMSSHFVLLLVSLPGVFFFFFFLIGDWSRHFSVGVLCQFKVNCVEKEAWFYHIYDIWFINLNDNIFKILKKWQNQTWIWIQSIFLKYKSFYCTLRWIIG